MARALDRDVPPEEILLRGDVEAATFGERGGRAVDLAAGGDDVDGEVLPVDHRGSQKSPVDPHPPPDGRREAMGEGDAVPLDGHIEVAVVARQQLVAPEAAPQERRNPRLPRDRGDRLDAPRS